MAPGTGHGWLALVALVALAVTTAGTAASRPNVLLILTDNQSPSLLGAYGNREIRTPNIDRLANEGTLFTRAFATSGVCSPARATPMSPAPRSRCSARSAST